MIAAAGEVALFGMDPLRFLTSTDPWERAVMQAVSAAARALQRRHDHERANLHAAEIMKMLQAGFKKGKG